MKILTWNILASEWVKKSYYPTVKTPELLDPNKRIKIILKRIKEFHGDIVLLQEVMEHEYKILSRQFQKDYRCSSLRIIPWSKTKTSSGNMTMLKKSMFKKYTEHPLEYGLYVKADSVSIFNLHLDDISSVKRRKQISDLRPFLEKEPLSDIMSIGVY
jgi:mRNA deadenylase 3'-5' endonuclease subunit Ccr4